MSSTNVVIYLRVSSKGQDNPEYGRIGLETQYHAILEWCKSTGAHIMGTFTDIGSAYVPNPNLPGLESAIKALRPGYTLLVHTASRFSRNITTAVALLQRIRDKRAGIFSVGEGYMTEQFPQAIASAQAQSLELGAKMRASVAIRRSRGHYIGQAPYGKRAVKNAAGIRVLEDDPDEQDVIEAIRVCCLERHWTFEQTTAFLNDEGSTKRGHVWTNNMVKALWRVWLDSYETDEEMDSSDDPVESMTDHFGNMKI